MSKFENVAVSKAANVYFEGNVTSRTLHFEDGSTKTLGIMLPGVYEFGTDKKETMDIMSGSLDVKLPESEAWISIKGGQTFDVPGKSKFQLKVHEITDYCCSFWEE